MWSKRSDDVRVGMNWPSFVKRLSLGGMEFLWTVTLPVSEGETASQTFASLKSASPSNTFYRINVPDLPTPNLDGLISLSDDLVKLNLQVEVSHPVVDALNYPLMAYLLAQMVNKS